MSTGVIVPRRGICSPATVAALDTLELPAIPVRTHIHVLSFSIFFFGKKTQLISLMNKGQHIRIAVLIGPSVTNHCDKGCRVH